MRFIILFLCIVANGYSQGQGYGAGSSSGSSITNATDSTTGIVVRSRLYVPYGTGTYSYFAEGGSGYSQFFGNMKFGGIVNFTSTNSGITSNVSGASLYFRRSGSNDYLAYGRAGTGGNFIIESNSAGGGVGIMGSHSNFANVDSMLYIEEGVNIGRGLSVGGDEINFAAETSTNAKIDFAKIDIQALDSGRYLNIASNTGVTTILRLVRGATQHFLFNNTDLIADANLELESQAGDPATSTDHAHVYANDVNSSAEIFVRDEAGNVHILSEGGTDSFSGSSTSKAITLTGVTTSSVFIVSINDATPVSDDMLSWVATANTLTVYRVAGTTSNLAFSWKRIK